MATLVRRRPKGLALRRDLENILEEFQLPRGLRNEIERLFDQNMAPRNLFGAMDRLFEDFVAPAPLRRRIARLLEPLAGGAGRLFLSRGAEAFAPQVELVERDDGYVLRIDLPGIREQDVDLRVTNDNLLTISGERRREETKRDRGYEYTEREYGSFMRSIELPRGADASKIEADFKNGVLEVQVPKGEAARSRQVPIRARELGAGREEVRALESAERDRREKSQGNANAPPAPTR
jgi:HSP20 family protein